MAKPHQCIFHPFHHFRLHLIYKSSSCIHHKYFHCSNPPILSLCMPLSDHSLSPYALLTGVPYSTSKSLISRYTSTMTEDTILVFLMEFWCNSYKVTCLTTFFNALCTSHLPISLYSLTFTFLLSTMGHSQDPLDRQSCPKS